jgi:hypothetical protein
MISCRCAEDLSDALAVDANQLEADEIDNNDEGEA